MIDGRESKVDAEAALERQWREEGRLPGQVAVAPPPRARRGRVVPDRWELTWVMERLEEAFEVLARTPMRTRPAGHGNSMPRYANSDEDRRGHSEKYGFAAPGLWVEKGWDEIETEIEKTRALRNRVRISPSPAEVARSEQALSWLALIPDDAAGSQRELRQAVGLGALWAEVDRDDVRKRCRARGMSMRTFNRRNIQGLKLITIELIRRRVPVS
jgi:hypothetical protein